MTRTTMSARFDLKFFRVFSNVDFPESVIWPFFTRKVSTVIFSEGGYVLSRSQNYITSNIWYLVHYDIRAKTRSRMTTATTFSHMSISSLELAMEGAICQLSWNSKASLFLVCQKTSVFHAGYSSCCKRLKSSFKASARRQLPFKTPH